MARIRTIKPEFFSSPDVCDLSPLARLAFIATWCEADREGRMRWCPRKMRLRYFPGDFEGVPEALAELETSSLLNLYTVEGELFAHVPGFTTHQVVNNREAKSELPGPDQADGPTTRDDTSKSRDSRVRTRESGRKEGKGREGKGRKEGEGKGTTNATRVAIDPSIPFSDFWNVYPRREGKAGAEKVWRRLSAKDRAAALADAPVRYADSERKFIPHGPTYLNGKRWQDDHRPPQQQARNGRQADVEARNQGVVDMIDPETGEWIDDGPSGDWIEGSVVGG